MGGGKKAMKDEETRKANERKEEMAMEGDGRYEETG